MYRRQFLVATIAFAFLQAASAEARQKANSAATGHATIKGSSTVTDLTEAECTRVGGTVTSDGAPALPACSTGKRCKTTSSNGDIHSVCIDEAN